MNSKIKEGLYNTRIEGKIASIREKSVSVQLKNDEECFLVVPLHRVPKILQTEGADVIIFLTTKYGHIGIHHVKENA